MTTEHTKLDYIPSDSDIAWTRNLIRIIKDGGTWAWPDAMLIYTFDKPAKTVKLMNAEALEDERRAENHQRFEKNLAAIGWMIVPEKE
jgi:hypothetical protein